MLEIPWRSGGGGYCRSARASDGATASPLPPQALRPPYSTLEYRKVPRQYPDSTSRVPGDGLAAPAARTHGAAPRCWALAARKLVRLCAGARPFFPAAWVPQKSVLDAVVAFGYSPADVAELRAAGAAKAAEIAQFGKVVDVGHSCALYGCAKLASYHQRVL